MEDRLITVAIHTYEKATLLKSLLESEGIEATLQNVNLQQPVMSSGVRVRIHEADLPKALRIIESSNGLIATAPAEPQPKGTCVLVPVDFSENSMHACQVAFRLAQIYGIEAVVMHSFIAPFIQVSMQFAIPLGSVEEEDEEEDNESVRYAIEEESRKRLDAFAEQLRQRIKDGALPDVKFTTRLVDDVPEDAINDLAKGLKPRLIVMGTRGAGKKERDQIGSVAAEVLDTCRFPVFTVPDSADAEIIPERCHVVMFCDYEQHDLLALDLFYSLFPNAHFDVTLMNVPSKKIPIDIDDLAKGLKEYCAEHYERFTFDARSVAINDMEAEFQRLNEEKRIDFIAVPNRRRNIFARLFNPSLAHRLLFHADIPMIVLPV